MQFGKTPLGCAIALGVACSSGGEVAGPAATFREFGLEAPAVAPLLPLTPLEVPTYDGSGEAVHPDIVRFPAPWHGYAYWMAFTPYPGGKQEFENPSIVASHDGLDWEVPKGLANPVVRRRTRVSHNSDPDLSWDPVTDQLVLLTREVRAGFNHVSLLTSRDGVQWTAPRRAFMRRNHAMISPAMVLSSARDPRLWYVDAGDKKCARRTTRVMRQEGIGRRPLTGTKVERGWGPPRPSGLGQPGYNIWHLDVSWIEPLREYWAVYPAYPGRQCGARDLFFARSPDGMKWTTYPVPLLRHADAAWTSAMLYRASALFDAGRDVMRLYLSASAPGPEWRLGVVEFKVSDLPALLSGGARAASAAQLRTGEPAGEETLP